MNLAPALQHMPRADAGHPLASLRPSRSALVLLALVAASSALAGAALATLLHASTPSTLPSARATGAPSVPPLEAQITPAPDAHLPQTFEPMVQAPPAS